MRSDVEGSHVGFDPVGLLIQPGQTVRFVCEANYHTTAAYHPGNANHSLRMPSTAQPWSSDVLQPGGLFEVTPGVYDYFCTPHEEAGMVGRLVGQPIGPGNLPFEARDWLPVPAAARTTFPPIDDIMRRGTVPGRPVWHGALAGIRARRLRKLRSISIGGLAQSVGSCASEVQSNPVPSDEGE